MRKGLVAILVLVCVALLGATVFAYSQYKRYQADFNTATAENEDIRQRYDRAVGEIVSIQDSLSAIVLGSDDGNMASSADVEMAPPQTLHDRGLARIAMLKSAIERTKTRIEELDANLKKSGVKIENLERLIAGLRRSVREKEERIAALTTQVDGLTTQVAEQQDELATIYYAMGTRKELQSSGVVEAKGGVLGFGKTLKPSGNYINGNFTPLNTDQESIILIPAHSAQIVSAQPATSYVLQPTAENTIELHITNPEEFRKIRHLVIVTAT